MTRYERQGPGAASITTTSSVLADDEGPASSHVFHGHASAGVLPGDGLAAERDVLIGSFTHCSFFDLRHRPACRSQNGESSIPIWSAGVAFHQRFVSLLGTPEREARKGTLALSKSDEFAHLAEDAERKANASTDPVAKRLWEAVATEWRDAENSARRQACGTAAAGVPRGES